MNVVLSNTWPLLPIVEGRYNNSRARLMINGLIGHKKLINKQCKISAVRSDWSSLVSGGFVAPKALVVVSSLLEGDVIPLFIAHGDEVSS